MYKESIEYLYGLQKFGIKFGLSNIKKLLTLLDNPHEDFKSIHIAGTNGKGSTSIFLSQILQAHGYRVGLYTSPHLVSFTERIRINNEHIREEEVIRLTHEIRTLIKESSDITPTFFEFVTAMAFKYFSEKRVDWAVIETGMGGRLDATNTIMPQVTIITNIGKDHLEFLGETIEEIAKEKCGIIKKGIPVITATENAPALKIIEDTATNQSSELHIHGKDFKGVLLKVTENGTFFSYTGRSFFEKLMIPVVGRHQIINASLAIRACEVLGKAIQFNKEKTKMALQNTVLEGRFEIFSERPKIILDGAHNPEAAYHLARTVKEVFPHKRIVTIVGIMQDKDIEGILSSLIDISSVLILTKASYERAAPVMLLNNIAKGVINKKNYLHVRVITTGTVGRAIDLARELCDEDGIILITGSFYTTGEAKEILGCPGVLSSLREIR